MPEHKVKIPQATFAKVDIPPYLEEAVFKVANTEDNTVECVIRTPSAQYWDSLTNRQQGKWREVVISLGKDPEDYLQHMKAMLPRSPKGAE